MSKSRPNGRSTRIHREPTEDDPRKTITRTDTEYRKMSMRIRVSMDEYNKLYRYAKSRKTTVAYLVREALKIAYPNVVSQDINRYIKSPIDKPLDFGGPTQILHSYVDGTTQILDLPPDFGVDTEDDDELD